MTDRINPALDPQQRTHLGFSSPYADAAAEAVIEKDKDQGPTRRRKDRETREAEITAAAFEVFTRDGLAAAKVDDVAELAKVSKGTVYTYFDTKEALFEAVVRRFVLASLDDALAVAIAEDQTHVERLKRVMKAAYTLFAGTEIRKVMILLIGEGGRFPGLIKFYHDEAISRGRDVIGRIVLEGIAAGEFKDVGAQDFPQVIMGPCMMSAIWLHHFSEFSPLDLDQLYEAHVNVLLNGLLASDGVEPTS